MRVRLDVEGTPGRSKDIGPFLALSAWLHRRDDINGVAQGGDDGPVPVVDAQGHRCGEQRRRLKLVLICTPAGDPHGLGQCLGVDRRHRDADGDRAQESVASAPGRDAPLTRTYGVCAARASSQLVGDGQCRPHRVRDCAIRRAGRGLIRRVRANHAGQRPERVGKSWIHVFSPSQDGSRASNSSAAASMASRADNEAGVARDAAQLANKIPRSAGIPSARAAARVPA